ncbi:MAG: hypothetical protein KAG26_08260 [Methylococcales bacterium]|nr:hypothetical protein [Methylococcales bacterium]
MAVSLIMSLLNESMADPIKINQDYTVNLPDASGTATLQCVEMDQRNWSRVGMGKLIDPEIKNFFLKQNIDRGGILHYEHWLYEQSGTSVAGHLLKDIVRIPALKYHNQALLLNVFEHVKLIPVDELLRAKPDQFKENFPRLMEKIPVLLEALQQPYHGYYQNQIKVKQRSYGSGSHAMNFKGLDIRNIGFDLLPSAGVLNDSDIILFDCVRPYLAPVEEAAAKIFISIGLLNWGKPLNRFIQGPDFSLLAIAQQYMAPYLDKQALEAELQLQASFRFSHVQGVSHSEVILKKSGLNVLGKHYLKKLQYWCDKEIHPH